MSEVGGPKQGLMNIGEEAKPPFAVLPDPSRSSRTARRRLAALAPKHELEPYLEVPGSRHAGPARRSCRSCRRLALPPVRAHRPGAGARHAARIAGAVRARRRRHGQRSSGCSAGWRSRRCRRRRRRRSRPCARLRRRSGAAWRQRPSRTRSRPRYGPARARRGRPAGALRAAGGAARRGRSEAGGRRRLSRRAAARR